MSNDVVPYQPKQRNPMIIKNLCPGLREMGKIKIGNKGAMRQSQGGNTWQAPQKLDHFLITTNERGQDNNFLLDSELHTLYGEAPKEIPVRLLYDDISLNFATRYICYYGKTIFCSGDGEEAQRLQADKVTYATRTCPCERQDPKFAGDVVNGQVKAGQGKCKINGILSVIIDGARQVGGVWKLRTTSFNSVVGILSSMAMIQRITGGRLAGIPMMMTVSPKTVANPLDGKQQTIYVVGLHYVGTVDTLRDTGYQIAMTEAKHGISMKRIEEDAMLMLTHTPAGGVGLGDEPDADVIEEFYPEQVDQATPALVIPAAAEAVEVPAAVAGSPVLVAPLQETEAVDMETGEVLEPTVASAVEPVKAAAKQEKPKAGKPKATAAPQASEEPPHPAAFEEAPHPAASEEIPMPEASAETPMPEDDGFPDLPGSAAPAPAAPVKAEMPGDLF